MLWDYFTDRRLDSALQFETMRKVDWDEFKEDGALTELHLIVSGLRYQDLETYIRAHPEELEQNDNMARCPLWYASVFGELAEIRTLLKYGAILNEDTFHFSYFLSKFGSKAFNFLDEHLSSDTLRSLFEDGCARYWFLDIYERQLDLDEVLAVDKLCFEHGFDVDYEYYERRETLLMTMLHESYPCFPLRVKQLLDHGADLELTDAYGKTALHYCTETYENGDIKLKLLNMLVEHGAPLEYRTWNGITMLHALILNLAQLEPINIILHSDISGLLLDAKDDNGYTEFDLLILRARLSRPDLGNCSVPLKASNHVDRIVEYKKYHFTEILGRWICRANDPDMERKVLAALEALLHKVQEVQGIPPEKQYPSIESVLDQEDIVAKASRLEGLPGSWPE